MAQVPSAGTGEGKGAGGLVCASDAVLVCPRVRSPEPALHRSPLSLEDGKGTPLDRRDGHR
jgi:hypothetical protein